MSTVIPNGYFHEGFLVFGNLGQGGVIARGYEVDYPDLQGSSNQVHDDLERDLLHLISSLKDGEKAQFHLVNSSDFSEELKNFSQAPGDSRPPAFCAEVRGELVSRFLRRQEQQTLIRSRARLYLSYKIQPLIKSRSGKKVRAFDEVFEVVRSSFDHREASFDQTFQANGGGFRALDNEGHWREFLNYWSPQSARHLKPKNINWLSPIDSLCRYSEASPRLNPDHGFYMDDHYFGVFTCKNFPEKTSMDTIKPFLNLTLPGLRMVINVEQGSVEQELNAQRKKGKELARNLDPKNHDVVINAGLSIPEERARLLLSGKINPCKAQLIVVAQDRGQEGLNQKLEAVRTVLSKLHCNPYQPTLPTSTLAFFNAATPGIGPWIDYNDFEHKVSNRNLVHLLPAGSTPLGDLAQADWISEGDVNQAVGFKHFIGAQPIDMLIIGPKGSGKSSTVQVIMVQGAHLFKVIVVIDDGLSYIASAVKLDPSCRPVVIKSSGTLSWNLFDTDGLPRTPGHLADATALVFLLVGQRSDEYDNRVTQSIISETIQEVYQTAYDAWSKDNPKEHLAVCREALTLLRYRSEGCDPDESLFDVFLSAREFRRNDPGFLSEFEEGISNAEALALAYNPDTKDWVRDLAFSTWSPRMFPRLRDLQDELNAKGRQGGQDAELCGKLARILLPWLAEGGQYGPLVDGWTNVSLGTNDVRDNDPLRVLYFDLGEIGEGEKLLKSVAGFLIANQVRNHLQRMPRRFKKQLILEELTAFMSIPGGEKLVIDYMERMRRFQVQVISVFQQWGSIEEGYPKAARALIGNSLSMLLLKNYRADLDLISRYRKLPDVVIERIVSFPQPESMKGRPDAYAGFCHVLLTGKEPRCVIGRMMLSEEVAKVVSSSGDEHEQKLQEIRDAKTIPFKAV